MMLLNYTPNRAKILFNTVCARSQVLVNWAQQCVHNVNGLYTLILLLPSDWRQCINQSVSVTNQARLR